ncbi:GNAT family N-acetyltransferase [Sphingomonas gilva]|nr:GNAT family N-acetyltransferase [Sphingomonas gilva]
MMFVRTERLLLRPGWAEDAPALAKAIAREDIVRNLARAPWPYRPYHAEEFLGMAKPFRFPSLLVFERTDGAPRLVGSCGIGKTDEGGAELGYWIAVDSWGRGYATEAARAVVAAARGLGHRRLEAGHFIDNPASGRVLEKVGFRATGQIVRRFSRGRAASAKCATYTLDLSEGDRTGDDDVRMAA